MEADDSKHSLPKPVDLSPLFNRSQKFVEMDSDRHVLGGSIVLGSTVLSPEGRTSHRTSFIGSDKVHDKYMGKPLDWCVRELNDRLLVVERVSGAFQELSSFQSTEVEEVLRGEREYISAGRVLEKLGDRVVCLGKIFGP